MQTQIISLSSSPTSTFSATRVSLTTSTTPLPLLWVLYFLKPLNPGDKNSVSPSEEHYVKLEDDSFMVTVRAHGVPGEFAAEDGLAA